MSIQIKKKFIKSQVIDGTKVLFLNDDAFKALKADGTTEVSLFKVNASDELRFLEMPKVSSDPVSGDDLSRKSYVDAEIADLQGQIDGLGGSVQTELDATQVGAGLETDGSYVAPVVSNYLGSATSLKDADSKLDTEIKSVADDLAQEIIDRAADVDAEESRALAAEGVIAGNLAQEILDRVADVDAEELRATNEEATLVKLDGSRPMTGALNLAGNDISGVSVITVDEITTAVGTDLIIAPDTLLVDFGGSILSNVDNPVNAQDVATKVYVDNLVAGVNSAAEIAFTPYGNIAATDVQAAIQELDDEKLALAGGTMTGSINLGAQTLQGVAALVSATGSFIELGADDYISFGPNGVASAVVVDYGIGSASASRIYDGTGDGLEIFSDGGAIYISSPMGQDIDMNSQKVTNLSAPAVSTDAATKGYVDTSIANLVDGAPALLDTLNELAAAINDDENFAVTITTSIGNVQSELDATQTGAGLGTNGSYTAPVGSNYLGSAVSLKDADSKLDTQIKTVADGLAQEIIDRATDVDAEESRALAAESALDLRIDSLEADHYLFGKESFVLAAGNDLSYIDLGYEVEPNSIVAFVDRLAIHKDEDYTVSVVSGVTRMTWINSLVDPGSEKLSANDKIKVTYARRV